METQPLEIHRKYDFDQIGEKDMYLLYHEELESLAQNIRGIKQIRFWMTFSQNYITHLTVLENVGMTSIEPIEFEGKIIAIWRIDSIYIHYNVLASKIVHEMFHAFQMSFSEKRFPNEFQGLFYHYEKYNNPIWAYNAIAFYCV